jgi:hypothetical protein
MLGGSGKVEGEEGPEEERMILKAQGGTYWRTNSRSEDVCRNWKTNIYG